MSGRVISMFMAASASRIDLDSFIFTVDTNNISTGSSNSDQYMLPLVNVFDVDVDWGDGSPVENVTSSPQLTHTYSSSGTYTVKLKENTALTEWNQNNLGDRLKILDIQQCGTNQWGLLIFYGSTNLTGSFTDIFNTTSVTDMTRMYQGCASWNVAPLYSFQNVTTTSHKYFGCSAFNQVVNISTPLLLGCERMFEGCVEQANEITMDTANVQDFTGFLRQCRKLNSLVNIDTSSGTIFNDFQADNLIFNQPLTYNLSNAVNTRFMFLRCRKLNQPLNFTLNNLTNGTLMYSGCYELDQPVTYDLPAIELAGGMYMDCRALNSTMTVSSSSLTNTSSMFEGCRMLDSAITINMTNVIDSSRMHRSNKVFNQSTSSYNTQNVQNMDNMYDDCPLLDQAIDHNMSSVTTATLMLNGTNISTSNYDAFLVNLDGQSLQNNVIIGVQGLEYTSAGAGGAARANIINNYGWTFAGDTGI